MFHHSFRPISSGEISVKSGEKLGWLCRLTVSRLSRFVLLLVFLSLAGTGWVSERSKCEVPINARLSHAGKVRRRQRAQRFPLPSSAFPRLSYFQRSRENAHDSVNSAMSHRGTEMEPDKSHYFGTCFRWDAVGKIVPKS